MAGRAPLRRGARPRAEDRDADDREVAPDRSTHAAELAVTGPTDGAGADRAAGSRRSAGRPRRHRAPRPGLPFAGVPTELVDRVEEHPRDRARASGAGRPLHASVEPTRRRSRCGGSSPPGARRCSARFCPRRARDARRSRPGPLLTQRGDRQRHHRRPRRRCSRRRRLIYAAHRRRQHDRQRRCGSRGPARSASACSTTCASGSSRHLQRLSIDFYTGEKAGRDHDPDDERHRGSSASSSRTASSTSRSRA